MSDEPEGQKQSPFWLNVPPLLFDTYKVFLRTLADADTRTNYIITMCELLSTILPHPIDEYDEFKAVSAEHPLSLDDPLRKIPYASYYKWVKAVQAIMRKARITGGRLAMQQGAADDDSAMIFDDFEDMMK